MAKKTAFILILALGLSKLLLADSPSRRGYSEIEYDTKKSSALPSAGVDPASCSYAISSGVVALFGIYVSSPGANSRVLVNSNYLAGFSSNSLTPGDLTTTQTNLPYSIETSTNGLVVTSTCSSCLIDWVSPDLRVTYERRN